MAMPETVAEEAAALNAEQQAPGETSDIEGVRAYMRGRPFPSSFRQWQCAVTSVPSTVT
jgi:hypothetical protein